MKQSVGKTIGYVWAVCDHFEKSTGQPVTLQTLSEVTGFQRQQFRKWVRQGRLVEHRVRALNGQEKIGYSRPKSEGRDGAHEITQANSSTPSQEG